MLDQLLHRLRLYLNQRHFQKSLEWGRKFESLAHRSEPLNKSHQTYLDSILKPNTLPYLVTWKKSSVQNTGALLSGFALLKNTHVHITPSVQIIFGGLCVLAIFALIRQWKQVWPLLTPSWKKRNQTVEQRLKALEAGIANLNAQRGKVR